LNDCENNYSSIEPEKLYRTYFEPSILLIRIQPVINFMKCIKQYHEINIQILGKIISCEIRQNPFTSINDFISLNFFFGWFLFD
jgi:hypothetical protein